MRLLQSGRVPVDELITAKFPLAQAPTAFAEASSGRHVKVVLIGEPEEEAR